MPDRVKNYSLNKNIGSLYRSHRDSPAFGRLDIELTERCNNNCLHCYINLREDDRKAQGCELTTEEWKRIIREAADLGYLMIRFTGGEPLLREDFPELYMFTRRLGMKVNISTNGRLLTPELADLFEKTPPMDKIAITAYGMHEKTYEAVSRCPGSFREFQAGVRLLLERKIPFLIRGVVLPMNREDIDEMDAWILSLPGVDEKPPFTVALDFRTRRDSPSKNRTISRLRSSPRDAVAFYSRDEEAYRNEMEQFCTRFMKPEGDILFSCGAGESGVIDAYGNYQPCMFVRQSDLVVDLNKVSLKDARTLVRSRIRELHATNPEYLRRCAHCFLHGLCEQCPGKSWGEHGTLDTPVDYLCEVAHEQARFLGLLDAGERAWEIDDWQARIARMKERKSG